MDRLRRVFKRRSERRAEAQDALNAINIKILNYNKLLSADIIEKSEGKPITVFLEDDLYEQLDETGRKAMEKTINYYIDKGCIKIPDTVNKHYPTLEMKPELRKYLVQLRNKILAYMVAYSSMNAINAIHPSIITEVNKSLEVPGNELPDAEYIDNLKGKLHLVIIEEFYRALDKEARDAIKKTIQYFNLLGDGPNFTMKGKIERYLVKLGDKMQEYLSINAINAIDPDIITEVNEAIEVPGNKLLDVESMIEKSEDKKSISEDQNPISEDQNPIDSIASINLMTVFLAKLNEQGKDAMQKTINFYIRNRSIIEENIDYTEVLKDKDKVILDKNDNPRTLKIKKDLLDTYLWMLKGEIMKHTLSMQQKPPSAYRLPYLLDSNTSAPPNPSAPPWPQSLHYKSQQEDPIPSAPPLPLEYVKINQTDPPLSSFNSHVKINPTAPPLPLKYVNINQTAPPLSSSKSHVNNLPQIIGNVQRIQNNKRIRNNERIRNNKRIQNGNN